MKFANSACFVRS